MRRQLLDIGKRNRLISAPVGKNRAKQLDIYDERSDEVFKILVQQGKAMTFEADGPDESQESVPAEEDLGTVFVPAEQAAKPGLEARHTDAKLGVRMGAEALQKRLLSLYRNARSLEDEQGVSVLFLALGFLRWYESGSSQLERFAPLVLLPVELRRSEARGRFRLKLRDEDMDANLSLRELLANDFQIRLPDLPEGDWLPSEYFQLVRNGISGQPRWSVEADLIELSFYSFARFLMWKDLASDGDWGEGEGAADHPLLARLLTAGFEGSPQISAPAENLDKRFPDPSELLHILEADASQTQVIAAAREGRNLVVQGPPGTGKSQTIANIIAGVAGDGKRVLFVAEKRAALDVVHDRLERSGLGALCLELHSHKASRTHFYSELKRTLDLGQPVEVAEVKYEQARAVRDDLNRMSDLLHAVDGPTGTTPHLIIGAIARLAEDGHSAPRFRISGAESWSQEEFAERCKVVADLASLTVRHGSEREHFWRGARRRVSAISRQPLADSVAGATKCADALWKVLESVAQGCGLDDLLPLPLGRAFDLATSQVEAAAEMPGEVPGLLASTALKDQPEAALALVERVHRYRELDERLRARVVESAFEFDWAEARMAVAARGRSLFRFLNGPYREALARLRAVARSEIPKQYEARLAILDELMERRRLRHEIPSEGDFGREAFGQAWRGIDTDVTELLPALRWIASQAGALGSAEAVNRQVAALAGGPDLPQLAARVRGAYESLGEAWAAVCELIDLDMSEAFSVSALADVDLATLHQRITAWNSEPAGIEDWHSLASAARHASALGLDEIRERLADGRMKAGAAEPALRFVRAISVWERMVREVPDLERIDGADRTEKARRFNSLDSELQHLAAREVAAKHHASIPRGSAGQVGIVRGEAGKKTRHMRIRRLLDKAGDAVIAIKPVFLMSPLSVAQYLKPGGLQFDLLLIDEASQVRPGEAMGAILRARQVVVVGDQKQLPPTSFFDRQTSGEEFDEDAPEGAAEVMAEQIGDMESILSLCDARAMAGLTLRWHYRSAHPSLIDVSNHEFYDSKLIYPPSPDRAGRDSGLTFVHVEDGVYDRGKRRNNRIEAERVCAAVLEHARQRPDLTLGVVALSVAQRDTINNAMELLRSEHPEVEAFCNEGRESPFFVKNLENVQGDERDVIFISIGYGRDAGGYMSQSFGPVSSQGGERRLNVLFTRAKRRCQVFASIRHDDIRLDATKHAGPRVLRRFLKFAATGEMDVPVISGRAMDSPFEEAVAKALGNHGYRVEAQVGSDGFRIDLAVYDPDDDGRFLLAVECDGARYHSSSWARERDRLRQMVLESKGWRFHRIWSTDWFYNRESEMARLLDALDQARRLRRNAESQPEPVPRSDDAASTAHDSALSGAGAGDVVPRHAAQPPPAHARVPYVEANLDIDTGGHELEEVSREFLAQCVAAVVHTEGPVSLDEVCRRISTSWGYRRAGSRIQSAIAKGMQAAVEAGAVISSNSEGAVFLDKVGRTGHPSVRDRSEVSSQGLRDLGNLPPSELRAGILQAVELNIGIETGDCAVEVARMLGFKTTRSKFRELIAAQALRLVEEGALVDEGGHLRLA